MDKKKIKHFFMFFTHIKTSRSPKTSEEWKRCYGKMEGFKGFSTQQIAAIDKALGSKTKINSTEFSPFALYYNLKKYFKNK